MRALAARILDRFGFRQKYADRGDVGKRGGLCGLS